MTVGVAPRAMPPEVGRVRVDGLELAYETFGDPAAPPLVLVMGLGMQMPGWPDDFCQDLADRAWTTRSCVSAVGSRWPARSRARRSSGSRGWDTTSPASSGP